MAGSALDGRAVSVGRMRVGSIHTYPVKGCRALRHDSAVVEPWGLAGDRRWLLVDPEGVAITQRDVAGLGQLGAAPGPDGIALSCRGFEAQVVPIEGLRISVRVWGSTIEATRAPAADEWLRRMLGVEARLVWLDDPTRRSTEQSLSQPGDRVSFADEFPLLLANTASLHRLNDWIAESGSEEGPLPMNRFRPNLVIEGAEPFAEDEWVGKTIQIGQVEFRVPQACGRCVVTTTNQETGERGTEPLRTLGRYRNVDQQLLFGVHLIPAAPGVVSVGDPVVT